MDFIKQFKTALEQMTPQQRAQYIKLIALDPQLSDISTPIICFIKKYYEVDSNNAFMPIKENLETERKQGNVNNFYTRRRKKTGRN